MLYHLFFRDYTGVTVPASIAPLNFVPSILHDKIDVTIFRKEGIFSIWSIVAAFPSVGLEFLFCSDNIGDSL